MRSRIAPPMTSVCGGSEASAGKRRSSSSRNMVAQHADAFDVHLDSVPRRKRSDSSRRAGENHITRLQRHDGGDELEEHGAGKHHHAGACVLTHITVDARPQREIGRIELRLDAWTDRTEGVEALSACELNIPLLQIARGDVVCARKAKDEIAPAARLHVA